MLQTDIALLAIAENSQLVNADAGQLIRMLIGEALVESEGEIRIVDNDEIRQEIQRNVQNGFREMRTVRRKTIPLRDLANELETQSAANQALADSLRSPAAILFIKQEAEQITAKLAQQSFADWQQESFVEQEDGSTKLRGEVAEQLERFMSRVAEVEQELADDDF